MYARRVITRLQREEGQYLALFALLLPLVFVLMGLVFDGGQLFLGYRRAALTANAAAQAGSQCLDVPHFKATNQVRLDRGQAIATAYSYTLKNRRQWVEVTHVTADYRWVTVHAQARVPMAFMSLLGVTEMTVRARGVARPHYGISRVWQ